MKIAHIEIVGADDIERLRQGAGFVLDGVHQNEVLVHLALVLLVQPEHAGERREARRVVAVGIDARLQDLQAVERRRLGGTDGRTKRVLLLRDALRRHGGVRHLTRNQLVALDVFRALRERLGMAVDLADPGFVRTGQAEQVLLRLELQHLVDIERTGEHQVGHGRDLAGRAVLERQHGHVAITGFAGAVRLLEAREGHQLRTGIQARGGDIGECAGHAAVRDLQAAAQAALPVARQGQHFLLEADIVFADITVLDAGGAAPQDIVLAGRVCGGEPMGRLVCGDFADELHPPLKERGDLRIHLVDLFSDYFELLHI